jgi:hypothetical protein
MNRGRCEHTAYPVEMLSVGGVKKKIAHCQGCEGLTEKMHVFSEHLVPPRRWL